MQRVRVRGVRAFVLLLCAGALVVAQDAPKRRNAIIFVADGLRHGSVNSIDTPALYRIRTEGVYFANSHVADRRMYLDEACFTKATKCD